MLSKTRVTLYNLDKGAKQWVLSQIEPISLTIMNNDCKFNGGKLLMDNAEKNMKDGGKIEHHLKIVGNNAVKIEDHLLEQKKKFLKFFGEYVVEVKDMMKHGAKDSKGE
jgi:hypothetical protein